MPAEHIYSVIENGKIYIRALMLNSWMFHQTRDYVIGFEPSNCHALGRDKMRQEGKLQLIAPGEERCFHVRIYIEDR
jgi:hypothetical protein